MSAESISGPSSAMTRISIRPLLRPIRMWGVYTDIIQDDVGNEMARYCGSGTALEGVQIGLKGYVSIKKGSRKSNGRSHAEAFQQQGT